MEQLLVVTFTFGMAIFIFLSMLEIPVWKLIFTGSAAGISNEAIRFVHKNLKYMTSKLPPSNGVVILAGVGLMIWQCVLLGWTLLPTIQLSIYVFGLFVIVVLLKNPRTVFSIRANDPETSDLNALTADLKNVGRDHHIGLLLNLTALAMQLALIWR